MVSEREVCDVAEEYGAADGEEGDVRRYGFCSDISESIPGGKEVSWVGVPAFRTGEFVGV